jgi:hypothetical protein
MKIAPDEIRGPRPNSIFASHRDAMNRQRRNNRETQLAIWAFIKNNRLG